MFKTARIMSLYTETSLHCGSGTSTGVVDLPIQREKHTDYPVCQASGIKGAVREWFENRYDKSDKRIIGAFGPDFEKKDGETFAGAATFTDARLLLFPVRSLNGVFAYTTSRFALSRMKRDIKMAGHETDWNMPDEDENKIFGILGSGIADEKSNKAVLEEYTFDFKADENVRKIAEWISENLFPQGDEYVFWKEKIKKDMLILPEDAFRDFVKLSTEVQARVRINNETKTVDKGALFYEEALPGDSLLYSVLMAHDPACDENKRPEGLKNSGDVMTFLNDLHEKRIQFGGDATIGRGIVNVNILGNGGGK